MSSAPKALSRRTLLKTGMAAGTARTRRLRSPSGCPRPIGEGRPGQSVDLLDQNRFERPGHIDLLEI